MEIKRVGTQPSAKGPREWFTGTVRIDPLFQAADPALVQGATVTFEPAARTDDGDFAVGFFGPAILVGFAFFMARGALSRT